MTPPQKASDIMRLRGRPGSAAALFITDRCPVGCAHCSVDSRIDSPTIKDFVLFKELVEGLAAQPALEVVGITGGEAFVERKGLLLATRILSNAGKKIVIYTSGVWARSEPASWISTVLKRTDTVYLSTDRYHNEGVDTAAFRNALRTIARMDCWIVVQAIGDDGVREAIARDLEQALGPGWASGAEIALTKALPFGRGASLFAAPVSRKASEFSNCAAIGAPVVRYDGRMTVCCNEQVIMGKGSARLAAKCGTAQDVRAAFSRFNNDPLLSVIRNMGIGALTQHPGFSDIGETTQPSICTVCWVANERVRQLPNETDPLLSVMGLIAKQNALEREVLP